MKYKGKMRITIELLKDLLKLDEKVDITDIFRSEEDRDYDTFTIYLSSKDKTNITNAVNEGARIPLVTIGGDINE